MAALLPSAECAPLMADVVSFNEMRLPESECWQCLPRAQCETRPRSHRVGRLWPRSCLPRSPINSNCLLQLFSGTMSDVFLLFSVASDAKQTFYHADKGQKGERLKGRPWMGWPNGWQKCGRGESIEVFLFSSASPEWLFKGLAAEPRHRLLGSHFPQEGRGRLPARGSSD